MTKFLSKIPQNVKEIIFKETPKLRPVQEKAILSGLFTDNNLIVSSPTASGKTLIAELAILDTIINKKNKVIYILPLKALANEIYKAFHKKYSEYFKVRISIGELQNEFYNLMFDLLIVTSEKLDSLIRHNKSILNDVGLIVVDEIHLINDEKRGPTLEILLTIFKTFYNRIKLIGLSATIKNGREIAEWLNAVFVEDNWRPIELRHYILNKNKLIRFK